ncbi:hypothetical protein ONZ45_g18710 [Pleurotus djamor]|nr:hypothetical protein ONZ45_g18710 [Pleurotus djamor]
MSHNISATVTIQYGGNKAVNILATKNHVTEDLLDLKLPRSKTENIVITPPSSVTLIWDSVAKNGVLHKHLLARTSRSHLALIREQLDHLEM